MASIESYQYVLLWKENFRDVPNCRLCKDEADVKRFCKTIKYLERIVYKLQDISPSNDLSNYKTIVNNF